MRKPYQPINFSRATRALALCGLAAILSSQSAFAGTAKLGDLKPASPVYHCNASLMMDGTNVLAGLKTLENKCAVVTPDDPSEKPWSACALFINGKNASDSLDSVGLPSGTWMAKTGKQVVKIEVEEETAQQEGTQIFVKQVGLGHDFWNVPSDYKKTFPCYADGYPIN